MKTTWKLIVAQLRMYVRDRQSVFFALVFPFIFMFALGYMVGGDEIDPIEVGLVASGDSQFVVALKEHPLLLVHEEDEAVAREAMKRGERDAVIFAPPLEGQTSGIPVKVLVNASELQQAERSRAIIQAALVDIERGMRDVEELFVLEIEDVDARKARYVDFLIPGLIAFMIMQLSIAGSGFNIVEYKRKGILKRLFVTPLKPSQFIASLIASRLVVIIVQVSLLLLVAKFAFDISMLGSLPLFYLFAIVGGILFLGLGFALGGIAKTQSSVSMIGSLVTFPQVFLAGVFFPLDSLPTWLQPVAAIMPLHFVSDSLRRIANEGAALSELGVDILGIAIWTALGVFLAIRFFRWGETTG